MGDDVDFPPEPEANWATAVRDKFYKPRREAISLRLGMDMLHWRRRKGPGYQAAINCILCEKMEAETVT